MNLSQDRYFGPWVGSHALKALSESTIVITAPHILLYCKKSVFVVILVYFLCRIMLIHAQCSYPTIDTPRQVTASPSCRSRHARWQWRNLHLHAKHSFAAVRLARNGKPPYKVKYIDTELMGGRYLQKVQCRLQGLWLATTTTQDGVILLIQALSWWWDAPLYKLHLPSYALPGYAMVFLPPCIRTYRVAK